MRTTRAGFLCLTIFLWTIAGAQASEECVLSPSAMTRLRAPEFSAPVLWKQTLETRPGFGQFADGVLLEGGDLALGGSYTAKREEAVYHPLLVRMGERGKIVWEMRGDAGKAQTIDRVALDGAEIVTLGGAGDDKGQTPKSLIVMRYDGAGKNLGGFGLGEQDGHLIPSAIGVSDDAYYIAARYENIRRDEHRFGVVYKVDKSGKRLWRRAYIPGLLSAVDDMKILRGGDILLAGNVRDRQGKVMGWLVRADKDGNIKWQKTYPRGRASQIARVAELPGQAGYIAGGVSYSAEGGDQSAGWVMRVDTSGHDMWNRYYYGDYAVRVTDILALPDGRSVAGLSALPTASTADEGNPPQVRLITLSPRGSVLAADSFADGIALSVNRVLHEQNRPVLIGLVRNEFIEDKPAPAGIEDGEEKSEGAEAAEENGAAEIGGGAEAKEEAESAPVSMRTFNAWVAELQGLPAYDDPCVRR